MAKHKKKTRSTQDEAGNVHDNHEIDLFLPTGDLLVENNIEKAYRIIKAKEFEMVEVRSPDGNAGLIMSKAQVLNYLKLLRQMKSIVIMNENVFYSINEIGGKDLVEITAAIDHFWRVKRGDFSESTDQESNSWTDEGKTFH